jgi:hypothetical protein
MYEGLTNLHMAYQVRARAGPSARARIIASLACGWLTRADELPSHRVCSACCRTLPTRSTRMPKRTTAWRCSGPPRAPTGRACSAFRPLSSAAPSPVRPRSATAYPVASHTAPQCPVGAANGLPQQAVCGQPSLSGPVPARLPSVVLTPALLLAGVSLVLLTTEGRIQEVIEYRQPTHEEMISHLRPDLPAEQVTTRPPTRSLSTAVPPAARTCAACN